MTAVSILLLTACANVSVLLLARSEARKQEIAMRAALGATTGRIVRQLLTETLLLALGGCALDLLFACCGVPAILAVLPETSLPHEAVVGMNLPVLAVAILISLATGLIAGLAPTLSLAHTAVHTTIHGGDRTTGGGKSGINTQTVLVGAEIALSTMLLVCSAIAVRNLVAVYQSDLSYNPRNVAVLSVSLTRQRKLSWEERRAYYERLERALTGTPGVQAVAETRDAIPPSIDFEKEFGIQGVLETGSAKAALGLVSSDYFNALRTPLLSGRIFSTAEVEQGAPVAVVNKTLARRLRRKGLTPVGAQIRLASVAGRGDASPLKHTGVFHIVGVVATIENQSLQRASRPAIYLPYTHMLDRFITFLVRTDGQPQRLERAAQS